MLLAPSGTAMKRPKSVQKAPERNYFSGIGIGKYPSLKKFGIKHTV